MGACHSICESTEPKVDTKQSEPQPDTKQQLSPNQSAEPILSHRIALKAPHGTAMQTIEQDQWVQGNNINDWIKTLFVPQKYDHWIVYNDEVDDHKISTSHGHCKGILAWNNKTIAWLIHSVPKFPRTFDGCNIADIGASELIYGQSFIWLEGISYQLLPDILVQLKIMNPYIYNTTVNIDWNQVTAGHDIREIALNNTGTLRHIAKAKHWNADIYEHIATRFQGTWSCETWVRGHECVESQQVRDVHEITWNRNTGSTHRYKRTQDHSKYACSQQHVYVGDINRMTSQFHRGGGGIILENVGISALFGALM